MAKLTVEVVSPERRLLNAQADEVVAPGADGQFGVRPGHTPYLALLKPGLLTVTDAGTSKKFFVASGFVEAGPERVRVLAAAEALEALDVAGAKKKLADSKAKLEALSSSAAGFARQREQVQIDEKRVEVVSASK